MRGVNIKKNTLFFATSFGLVILLYVFAVFYTFRPRGELFGAADLIGLALTLLGGLGIFALGSYSRTHSGEKRH